MVNSAVGAKDYCDRCNLSLRILHLYGCRRSATFIFLYRLNASSSRSLTEIQNDEHRFHFFESFPVCTATHIHLHRRLDGMARTSTGWRFHGKRPTYGLVANRSESRLESSLRRTFGANSNERSSLSAEHR